MQGSALSSIFKSRKGIAAFVAVLFGLVYVIGIVVAAVLGKLSWSDALQKIQVASGMSTAAIIALILGVAHEDAAQKSAGPSPSDTIQ